MNLKVPGPRFLLSWPMAKSTGEKFQPWAPWKMTLPTATPLYELSRTARGPLRRVKLDSVEEDFFKPSGGHSS